MNRKAEFSKTYGNISIVSVEAADIYSTLPRPAGSNGLIVVILKWGR